MRKHGVIAGIAGVLIGGLTFGGVTAVHAASTGQPPQPVTVTNTATQPVPISQPAIPRTQFSVTEECFEGSGGACTAPVVATANSPSRFVVSSLSVTNSSASPVTINLGVGCATIIDNALGLQVTVPAQDTREVTFPQPFILPDPPSGCSSMTLSEGVSEAGTPSNTVSLVGYIG